MANHRLPTTPPPRLPRRRPCRTLRVRRPRVRRYRIVSHGARPRLEDGDSRGTALIAAGADTRGAAVSLCTSRFGSGGLKNLTTSPASTLRIVPGVSAMRLHQRLG